MKTEFTHYRTDLPEGPQKASENEILALFGNARVLKQVNVYGRWRRVTGQWPNIKAAVICTLTMNDGTQVCGYSFCSKKDNFVIKRGRSIAYGRARKALEEKS